MFHLIKVALSKIHKFKFAIILSISTLVITNLSLVVLFLGDVCAEELNLKLASWSSPKHFIGLSLSSWIKEVNEKGTGKVKIILYPGGQLYGSHDMHSSVAKGYVEIGEILQAKMISMVPMLQGTYLPFFFDTVEQAVSSFQGESREILERAFAKKNLKLLFPMFLDGVQLHNNKKNLKTIEEFKGMKLLMTSNYGAKILNAMGASPDNSIPFTEEYMALKRGIADGNLNTITSAYFRKNFEVCKYITNIDMGFTAVLVMVNLKTWNSLSPEIRELMENAGKRATQYSIASSKAWLKKYTEMTMAQGVTINSLPESEIDKIKTLSAPIWAQWAQTNGDDAKRFLELNAH